MFYWYNHHWHNITTKEDSFSELQKSAIWIPITGTSSYIGNSIPLNSTLSPTALRHSWISEFICYSDLNYWSDSCWNEFRFSKRPFALHEHQTSIYIHSYLYIYGHWMRVKRKVQIYDNSFPCQPRPATVCDRAVEGKMRKWTSEWLVLAKMEKWKNIIYLSLEIYWKTDIA